MKEYDEVISGLTEHVIENVLASNAMLEKSLVMMSKISMPAYETGKLQILTYYLVRKHGVIRALETDLTTSVEKYCSDINP
jgi:hypothetical protein